MRDLVVLVEDEPPEDQHADLLGLYDGVALTHRDSWGTPMTGHRHPNAAVSYTHLTLPTIYSV